MISVRTNNCAPIVLFNCAESRSWNQFLIFPSAITSSFSPAKSFFLPMSMWMPVDIDYCRDWIPDFFMSDNWITNLIQTKSLSIQIPNILVMTWISNKSPVFNSWSDYRTTQFLDRGPWPEYSGIWIANIQIANLFE